MKKNEGIRKIAVSQEKYFIFQVRRLHKKLKCKKIFQPQSVNCKKWASYPRTCFRLTLLLQFGNSETNELLLAAHCGEKKVCLRENKVSENSASVATRSVVAVVYQHKNERLRKEQGLVPVFRISVHRRIYANFSFSLSPFILHTCFLAQRVFDFLSQQSSLDC